MGLLERLKKGIVICAEGYIFEMERRGYVKAGPFVPEVVLDYPDAVKELHREFLLAGSDVIEALTYYADRYKMGIVGRGDVLEELNRQAIRLAKEVAQEGNALVAGNICNTWVYDHRRHEQTAKIVRAMYKEQVGWAKAGDVDFVIAETISHVGEAVIALEVIKSFGLPAVVTFAAHGEKTEDGYEWDEACRMLEEKGADVVGLNCTRGPDTMLPILKKIRKAVKGYVAALPVAYRTTEKEPRFQSLTDNGKKAFPSNLDPFFATRDDIADFTRKAQKMGINYMGVCCGAGPHHIRAMAEALGRTVPASKYSPDMTQHGDSLKRL